MMNNECGVSIVMLSFNRKNDVAEGISELLAQEYPHLEIIVVDNGSSDGTAEMITEKFPHEQVKLINLPHNIGVAAYNIGFKKAVGKYIVILDDDSFPGKTAIPRMVEEFEKNSKLGAVAFDIRNYEEFKHLKEKNEVPTPNPSNPSNPSNTSNTSNTSNKSGETRNYRMAFNGCGVGIRKSIIDRVGGYPEEFFLYWNEQDLAIRILDAGYQIQTFTGIIAYHKYSLSNRGSLRAPFYYTRNLYWLIWKYFPLLKLIKDTLKLLYCSFYYTLEQKTLVYLKATISAICNIKKIKRKPAAKDIIKNLRLTYKLAFIYYK
ncbi:MAG TPA: glycosyltransferase family 2 protein [Candidatus Deferrimicrobium sp.]|nr:glycosyltransferase family 2 protein [Candidatus Deferrimicrobium sp.]